MGECLACGNKQPSFRYRTYDEEPLCADCYWDAVDTLKLPTWVSDKLGLNTRPTIR